jgi:hypothetical protein
MQHAVYLQCSTPLHQRLDQSCYHCQLLQQHLPYPDQQPVPTSIHTSHLQGSTPLHQQLAESCHHCQLLLLLLLRKHPTVA